jgi:spore germination cell wall hydrolase CwlJ-like protein
MRTEDKIIFNKLSVLEAIALTIYGEARGESWEGKLAVGFVIMNRSRLWKKSIKEIVYAPNQFSCYLSNDPNYPLLRKIAETRDFMLTLDHETIDAATSVYMSPTESTVDDATFYRVKGTKNKWFDNAVKIGTLVYLKCIKTHEFFKEAV